MSRSTTPIQARVRTETLARLDAWAASRGLSRNAAVNLIITDALDRFDAALAEARTRTQTTTTTPQED